MSKVFNIIMFFLIIFFILFIFKYYSSNKNVINKDFNRINIDKILDEKVRDLPVLFNDTNNIIEFNDSFDNEIKDEKKRSFWELLKR
tara:strand:+ start:495 stop:755 length:261 start_codon:yes stop_codon:yes gene_type:complete